MACFWHTPRRMEGCAMADGQEDVWWGVLFATLMLAILLGSLLVLPLTGAQAPVTTLAPGL